MKNSNSGHCVQDPSDACFTTVPHDNDILLCLGLCVSWHLTVVHNYIIASLLLIPYLKIRLSSHCLKAPRKPVFWVQANVSRTPESSFWLFQCQMKGKRSEQTWMLKIKLYLPLLLRNDIYLSIVPSKYLLLFFFFLICYPSPKSRSRLLQ